MADEATREDDPMTAQMVTPHPEVSQNSAPSGPDRRQRDQLVTAHLGLAHQLARRFVNRGEAHDDLVQVASLALVRAAERFDAERGIMFSTFAAASIVGELKRHFRDRGWAVRAPRRLQELFLEIGTTVERLGQELGRAPTVPELAEAIDASETDILEALEAGQGYRASSLDAPLVEGQTMADSLGADDDGFTRVEHRSALAQAMESLSARDRTLVHLRFVEGRSQSQIAAQLGVSQMQVSRLLANCLRQLRTSMDPREHSVHAGAG
jgi:RNA polymerase sigma-B factor